ncbi:MAG: type ISP restriction/modification enzyme [Anaerolineae bacterium]
MPESSLASILRSYSKEAVALRRSRATSEESYYPALRTLFSELLRLSGLRFRVVTGISESREGAGRDRPDIGIFDETGEYLVVPCEIKTADVDLKGLAFSTERNDQIGRYLAQAGIVLLSNVRSFGLVALRPGVIRDRRRPVQPKDRDFLATVDLWPSLEAFQGGKEPILLAAEPLRDLLESAVTEFAPIADAQALAAILARQARRAKADLPDRFDSVASLLQDYGVALGLTFEGEEGEEFFRSSLIQTAFYGLFAGWTIWHLRRDGTEFDWARLESYLEIPFLGKLFYEFRHPDRLAELRLAPHLDRAMAALRRVDRTAFFKRFLGPGNEEAPGPDRGPALLTATVTYFYEPFLEAFDPTLRKELGVWYTPPEVVRYQVRRVDELLRRELGVARGLADDEVVVLDPCCGTGAYLIEAIRVIAAQLQEEGESGTIGAHLLDAVCRRVLGFEILTAPFVIAQLQLHLLLTALGASPGRDRRPAVFLTNALTGWEGPEQIKLNFPELQAEHDAAQHVKRDARIIVVLGNPPYNRFAGVPINEEADLADHYKGIRRDSKGRQVGQSELFRRWRIRKHLLDDLYIRFFRLAEREIGEKAHFGIVTFISNSSFLTGRSHPLMRESLLRNFDAVWIDNCNGDKYRTGKLIPQGLPGEGTSDQSIFTTERDHRGIQVGTVITTWLKRRQEPSPPEGSVVRYRDFWGKADAKRAALLESLGYQEQSGKWKDAATWRPEGPRAFEVIRPTAETRWMLSPSKTAGGYDQWPALDELFPVSFQGVNPNRGLDGSVVDMEADALAARMRYYFAARSFAEIEQRSPELARPRAGYEPGLVWKTLCRDAAFREDRVLPYLLFPLDLRFVYYETTAKLLNRHRPEFGENLRDNEFLLSVPQPRRTSETRPLIARTLADLHVHDRGTVCFPLHVRNEVRDEAPLFDRPQSRAPRANLAPDLWAALGKAWSIKGTLSDQGAIELARSLFRLVLAMVHAPQYEDDHREALSIDWARLPIPRAKEVFSRSVDLGTQVALLLDAQANPSPVLRSKLPKAGRTLAVVASTVSRTVREEDLQVLIAYNGAASGRWIEREYGSEDEGVPATAEATGDLYISETVCFRNVPAGVWRYRLGGYPVLKKWLGHRQANRRAGRPLTLAESRYFRSIVQRIAALIALGPELDAAYATAAADAFTVDELGL